MTVPDKSCLYLRDRLEQDEDRRLAISATRSAAATFRWPRSEDYRLAFQRDRDRILHSRAFRRLKHKTQVFVPHLADHRRTRLTHTLEVAQIGRTIARALGLNEDLVEAIAYGHDLGHTAFGHTGETILNDILAGGNPDLPLPAVVTGRIGAFKHNYQSIRVVDLLERRYDHPGLNLSDQVREGILKHTSWRPGFPFPLPDEQGLRTEQTCHLEGQTVAVADEIAQQTHDLEDGLRVGSVDLESVTPLRIAATVLGEPATHPEECAPAPRWQQQSKLIRGMIGHFVSDVIHGSAARLASSAGDQPSPPEPATSHEQAPSSLTVWFTPSTEALFDELKAFIYQFIINQSQVNRQDWRARKVITGLFRAFWLNPLNLPSYLLLRAKGELGLPYLRDLQLASVAAEVSCRYHTSPGFVRLVADHIAGMSDRFALEEYQSLEHPSAEQRFLGD